MNQLILIRVVFLILIVSVSLLYTTNVAYTVEGSSSYGHSICIFSVLMCLYDQQSQEEIEQQSDNEKYIYSVLDQVNSTELEIWIDNLSSFHTRHTKSDYIESVAYWLKNELQGVCSGKIYFHNFT